MGGEAPLAPLDSPLTINNVPTTQFVDQLVRLYVLYIARYSSFFAPNQSQSGRVDKIQRDQPLNHNHHMKVKMQSAMAQRQLGQLANECIHNYLSGAVLHSSNLLNKRLYNNW